MRALRRRSGDRLPPWLPVLIGLLLACAAFAVLGDDDVTDDIDWLNMGMGLFGGLALFLFGMEQMADALKAVAGDRMKDILARLTTNRVMGALTGAFVSFTGQFARLAEWLVPDKPLEEEDLVVRAKYLDDVLLTTPSLALDRVRLETLHMGERVQEMMERIMPAILSGNKEQLHDIERMDDDVDMLHAQIIDYLGKISRLTLTETQTGELIRLMEAVNELENIGDVIETNLIVLGHERIDEGVSISQPTREVLTNFHYAVNRAVECAVQAVAQNNQLAARTVISMKQEINRIAESAAAHQAQRLVAEEPNRIRTYTIEVDIIEKLKRIYYFAKRMAKTVDSEESVEEA